MSVLPLILSAAFTVTAVGRAEGSRYRIVDLGTLGGTYSAAHAVNASGDVVGEATTADGATHAFLYGGADLTDLGTLPGGNRSVAYAINVVGQVVGYADDASGTKHAFLFDGGHLVDLGILPNGTYSIAHGIADNGTIVGEADVLANGKLRPHGFVREPGKALVDLGGSGKPLGSPSVITAIDDHFHLVGFARLPGLTDPHGFYFSLNAVTTTARDLGTLGGGTSKAYAINKMMGGVVGSADAVGGAHAFFVVPASSGGKTLTDLGTLGGPTSAAFGINDAEQIVGTATGPDGGGHAVLWENGAPTDLATLIPSSSGWFLDTANAINDAGVIVGWGTLCGQTHAFTMVPGGGTAVAACPATTTTMALASTTTTTTALGSTTTTTLDPAAICAALPNSAAAACLLRRAAELVASASLSDVRTGRLRRRLQRLVARALAQADAAGAGPERARHLRRTQRPLAAILVALRQGSDRHQITADLANSLQSLTVRARDLLRDL